MLSFYVIRYQSTMSYSRAGRAHCSARNAVKRHSVYIESRGGSLQRLQQAGQHRLIDSRTKKKYYTKHRWSLASTVTAIEVSDPACLNCTASTVGSAYRQQLGERQWWLMENDCKAFEYQLSSPQSVVLLTNILNADPWLIATTHCFTSRYDRPSHSHRKPWRLHVCLALCAGACAELQMPALKIHQSQSW